MIFGVNIIVIPYIWMSNLSSVVDSHNALHGFPLQPQHLFISPLYQQPDIRSKDDIFENGEILVYNH
jgi:hypothetical protein